MKISFDLCRIKTEKFEVHEMEFSIEICDSEKSIDMHEDLFATELEIFLTQMMEKYKN